MIVVMEMMDNKREKELEVLFDEHKNLIVNTDLGKINNLMHKNE